MLPLTSCEILRHANFGLATQNDVYRLSCLICFIFPYPPDKIGLITKNGGEFL